MAHPRLRRSAIIRTGLMTTAIAVSSTLTGVMTGCEELLPRQSRGGADATSTTASSDDTTADASSDASNHESTPSSADSETDRSAKKSPTDVPKPEWPRTHTIAQGETLYSIAKRYYGDGSKWPLIEQANPGIHATGLLVDRELIIPEPE